MIELLVFSYVFMINFQNIKIFENTVSIAQIGIYYLFPIILIFYILNIKKIKNNIITRKYYLYIYYLTIVNFLLILVMILCFNSTEMYNKSYFIKYIHIICNILLQILFINVLYFLLKKMNFSSLRKIFFFNYFLNFLFFIYEKIYIHSLERVKLFSPEPSIAAYIITIIFLMTLSLEKKILYKFFLICSYLYMIYYIRSKGIIFVLVVCLLIMLKKNFNFNKMFSLFSLLFLVVGSLPFFRIIYQETIIDIEKFTSVVTRTWSMLTALVSFALCPIGYGGTYLYVLKEIGKYIKNFFIINFPTLNYSEIDYMLDTGIALVPKSGFLFGVLVGGIGYIFLQYSIFKFFYTKLQKEYLLQFLLLVYFISNITYITDSQTPMQIIIFPFLFYIIQMKKGRKEKC